MRPTMSAETAAAVLNVALTATRPEVDRAFRLRARMCHPDRFAGAPAADLAAASAEFIRVCDAREVLHRWVARVPGAPSAPPAAAPRASPGGSTSAGRAGPAAPPYSPRSSSSSSYSSSSRSSSSSSSSSSSRSSSYSSTRSSASSSSTEAPAAPQNPTLSFAEFVRARDTASWVYASPAAAPRSWARPRRAGRAARPRRTSRAFRVSLLVLAVVSVGGYLALQLTTDLSTRVEQIAAPLAGSAGSGSDLLAEASVVPVEDEATLALHCQSDVGCWMWSVTARTDCPAATITVGFSAAADGQTSRTSSRQVPVQAEVPFLVVESALSDLPEYARLEAMSC